MIKRILKRLAWAFLTTDIYYKGKEYHADNGRAADYALVKAWKSESLNAFMADPNWRSRIARKELAVMAILILLLGAVVFFALLKDTYVARSNLQEIEYALDKYDIPFK